LYELDRGRIRVRHYIDAAFRVTSNKGIDMADLDVGDLAPQFDLPRDGGGSLGLTAFRGKPVVLYFDPQDDTTSCTTEAIGFSQLKPEFEKAGAVVIGLSPDSVKKHDKFKTKYDLTIDLVADEERKVIEAYNLWVEKTMYGRNYMGVERATFLIGKDGKIARIWRKVRVKGHAEEVLEAVRAL
jgi:thioredoxin-dependent peroxiredoxin